MFKKICLWVLIIGGICLSLKGLFSFDLLAWICGGTQLVAARIVYALFGLAAVGYLIADLCQKSKRKSAEH